MPETFRFMFVSRHVRSWSRDGLASSWRSARRGTEKNIKDWPGARLPRWDVDMMSPLAGVGHQLLLRMHRVVDCTVGSKDVSQFLESKSNGIVAEICHVGYDEILGGLNSMNGVEAFPSTWRASTAQGQVQSRGPESCADVRATFNESSAAGSAASASAKFRR